MKTRRLQWAVFVAVLALIAFGETLLTVHLKNAFSALPRPTDSPLSAFTAFDGAAISALVLLPIFLGLRALDRRRLGESAASRQSDNQMVVNAALKADLVRVTEQSALLDATLQNMEQGVLLIGPDRNIRLSNKHAAESLGLSSETLASLPTLDDAIAAWG